MTIENAKLLAAKANADETYRLQLEKLQGEDFELFTATENLPCNKDDYLKAAVDSGLLPDSEMDGVVGGLNNVPYILVESKNHKF